ncbi:MAG: hypothetical protein MJZ37_07210 [Bacilli bacterium]|nr:hypothetical protein [Bacilli bacterium]
MKYNVVIDCLGSDKGPEAIIEGAIKSLNKFDDLFVTLAGPKDLITSKMNEANIASDRYAILEADDTITNYENPTVGIMSKPKASLVQALKEANKDENIGIITAGNSGAILMGGLRFLSTPERTRPCMSAVLPNAKGGFTILVDTGASIDVGPSELVSFAHLGSDFMKKLFRMESPRVGILSNGAEKGKGNHLVKETYPLLESDTSINFVGNIEGNMSLAGECDVLVCDGFAGNQVLKNSEGMAKLLITEIVKFSKMNNKPELMEVVGYLMSKYDFGSLGGGIVLGVKKPILKCRGNSDSAAIVSTVQMLINFADGASTVY